MARNVNDEKLFVNFWKRGCLKFAKIKILNYNIILPFIFLFINPQILIPPKHFRLYGIYIAQFINVSAD